RSAEKDGAPGSALASGRDWLIGGRLNRAEERRCGGRRGAESAWANLACGSCTACRKERPRPLHAAHSGGGRRARLAGLRARSVAIRVVGPAVAREPAGEVGMRALAALGVDLGDIGRIDGELDFEPVGTGEIERLAIAVIGDAVGKPMRLGARQKLV